MQNKTGWERMKKGIKLNFLYTNKYKYRKKRLKKSIKKQARKDNKSKNVRKRERKEKPMKLMPGKEGQDI
jgi:hypothetical protein